MNPEVLAKLNAFRDKASALGREADELAAEIAGLVATENQRRLDRGRGSLLSISAERMGRVCEAVQRAAGFVPSDLEFKALALADDPDALYGRLREAVKSLGPSDRKGFARGKAVFDFEKKSLSSTETTAVLQWRVRRQPDEPVSYRNQQTSVGVIGFESR